MKISSRKLLAVVAAGLGLGLGWPTLAEASEPSAACSVRVIEARDDKAAKDVTVDPQLEPLRKQLTSPPLSAWKSFKLLKLHELVVRGDAPAAFDMPGEHDAKLSFKGKVDSDRKTRLRLTLEMLDGRAKLLSTTFVLDDGGTVLQAGTKHEGALVVLGITCRLQS